MKGSYFFVMPKDLNSQSVRVESSQLSVPRGIAICTQLLSGFFINTCLTVCVGKRYRRSKIQLPPDVYVFSLDDNPV